MEPLDTIENELKNEGIFQSMSKIHKYMWELDRKCEIRTRITEMDMHEKESDMNTRT